MKTIISDQEIVKDTKNQLTERRPTKGLTALAGGLLCICQIGFAQESLAPPGLGEDTKGTPAVAERQPLPVEPIPTEGIEETAKSTAAEDAASEENYGPLGQATITETRRESGGQVYRVELEHSIGGGKQILEESDSDGNLETRSTGLDEEVNIPKWRIGSW